VVRDQGQVVELGLVGAVPVVPMLVPEVVEEEVALATMVDLDMVVGLVQVPDRANIVRGHTMVMVSTLALVVTVEVGEEDKPTVTMGLAAKVPAVALALALVRQIMAGMEVTEMLMPMAMVVAMEVVRTVGVVEAMVLDLGTVTLTLEVSIAMKMESKLIVFLVAVKLLSCNFSFMYVYNVATY
jgi:hypothetical protein